jgi:hypothetical protein
MKLRAQRKRLVDDDSGHYYVIPAEKREEWDKWIDSEAWEDGDVPAWAERLNMHQINYTFTDWREDR